MNLLTLEQGPDLTLSQPATWNLKPGQVRIWALNLDADPASLDAMAELLSGDEVARAGKFKFARDRRRFIAARAGLREILAGILGESPDALRFEYSERGKPALWGQDGARRLCFNLSHSADFALVAAAWDLELGIDLEAERDEPAFSDMAQFVLNAPEKDWLFSHPFDRRNDAFYRIWTLKEAVLKATGEGLGAALRSYCILPQEGDAAVVQDYEKRKMLGAWKAQSFVPKLGFRAAIAYAHPKIEEFQLDSGISFAY